MFLKNKNLMVGTGIYESGGIATVIRVLKDSGLLDEWNIELIQTHENKSRFFGINKFILFFIALCKIVAYLFSGQVGFVHIHLASNGSFTRKKIVLSLCHFFKTPVIFHLHGGGFRDFYNKSSLKKQKKIRKAFNLCDRVVVLSSQWRKWVESIVEDRDKVIIIYNTVPGLPSKKMPSVPRTILFLGRLEQAKGIYDLLEAARLLKKEFPDFKLLLGGNGDIEACKEFIYKNNLQLNIKLLGWINGEPKENLLLTSEVYVLPSYVEGFPMGVLEAMSAGLPVIASKAGGISDAITSGVDGVLIDAGDVDALYLALKDAFSNRLKYLRFAENAKMKFQENFSLDIIKPKLSSMYQDLLMKPEK